MYCNIEYYIENIQYTECVCVCVRIPRIYANNTSCFKCELNKTYIDLYQCIMYFCNCVYVPRQSTFK